MVRVEKNMGMNRRYALVLVAACLLFSWLLYGGLELAEELQLVVKVQTSDRDLDMEVLAQLASALKSNVPNLIEPPPGPPTITHLVLSFCVAPQRLAYDHCLYPVPALASLRLHQYLSVYRI